MLFSLPVGVWLDRVRKLPVYVAGELTIGVVVASVPLAWWVGWLSIDWLYVCGFVIGTVYTIAGSAAQIVLTQVVARDRLVEAHAKNALAVVGRRGRRAGPGRRADQARRRAARVAGRRRAGDGLGGDPARHPRRRAAARAGVGGTPGASSGSTCRPACASSPATGCWSRWRSPSAAGRRATRRRLVVQILFATRTLGLSEQAVGLCFIGMGVGTVLASVFGNRISRRIGPGPCLVLGFAVCGAGWLLLAVAPANAWGVAAFALMLMMFSTGAVFIFINFLALRQAVTPAPLLGRMTSTMRWLILIPAGPGALLGGWLGEHVGLRASLAVAGGGSAAARGDRLAASA